MGYDDDRELVERRCTTEWNDRTTWGAVAAWLAQFDEPAREYAVKLLKHFQFYSFGKVSNLLRLLHTTFLKERMVAPFFEAGEGLSEERDTSFRQQLKHSLFVQMSEGDAPKSGNVIGYLYRLTNNIATDAFTTLDRLDARMSGAVQTVVLLDDFLGTGLQALAKYNDYVAPILARRPELRVYLSVCVATAEGIGFLESHSTIQVVAAETLSDSSKAFSAASTVFEDLNRDTAYQVITEYGRRLWDEHPLGFGDSQLLIGFHWCPPDNTVTAIWWPYCDTWVPLFPRVREEEK